MLPDGWVPDGLPRAQSKLPAESLEIMCLASASSLPCAMQSLQTFSLHVWQACSGIFLRLQWSHRAVAWRFGAHLLWGGAFWLILMVGRERFRGVVAGPRGVWPRSGNARPSVY